MMTVKQVSRLTGVSIRTLRYYDRIGLLAPAAHTEGGYRLYDDQALERLQQILLFRELEFPLKDIKRILDHPNFDRTKALDQQIELLLLKKEHIENLLILARDLKLTGGTIMNFEPFDTAKLDAYAKQAKERWGATPEYREFEEKHGDKTASEQKETATQLMAIFTAFGALREQSPDSGPVQAQVKQLQDFITAHYYTCSKEVLSQLGAMYASGGSFTRNIDAAGGPGTAEFTNRAIQVYCR